MRWQLKISAGDAGWLVALCTLSLYIGSSISHQLFTLLAPFWQFQKWNVFHKKYPWYPLSKMTHYYKMCPSAKSCPDPKQWSASMWVVSVGGEVVTGFWNRTFHSTGTCCFNALSIIASPFNIGYLNGKMIKFLQIQRIQWRHWMCGSCLIAEGCGLPLHQ